MENSKKKEIVTETDIYTKVFERMKKDLLIFGIILTLFLSTAGVFIFTQLRSMIVDATAKAILANDEVKNDISNRILTKIKNENSQKVDDYLVQIKKELSDIDTAKKNLGYVLSEYNLYAADIKANLKLLIDTIQGKVN